MKSLEELKQLVQQAKDGDSTAFSNLYEHYLTPIFRFIFFRVRTKKIDETVIHDVRDTLKTVTDTARGVYEIFRSIARETKNL